MSKKPIALPGVLLFVLLVTFPVLLFVVVARSSGSSSPTPEALPFSASAEESATRKRLIQSLIEAETIHRVTVDREHNEAEVLVLPAFDALNIDQKSSVLRLCYFDAFGLPDSATRFSGLLYLRDGNTGKQLRTFDLASRGLSF